MNNALPVLCITFYSPSFPVSYSKKFYSFKWLRYTSIGSDWFCNLWLRRLQNPPAFTFRAATAVKINLLQATISLSL